MLALTSFALIMTGSQAAMAYIKVTLYASGTCEGTATGYSNWGIPDVCQGSGTGYVMSSCNSTHYSTQIYTDDKCKTKSTASSSVSNQELACNSSTASRSVDCKASGDVGIFMRFTDSGCTDAKFAGFSYVVKDMCFGSSSYYKWECDASDTKKLIKQYYTDKACTTKDTSKMTAYSTETCVVASTSSSSNGSNSSRRLQHLSDGDYFRLYSGCGTKGTLPAGVTAPSTSNTGTGQVSSARVMLGSFPLLAAAVMIALK